MTLPLIINIAAAILMGMSAYNNYRDGEYLDAIINTAATGAFTVSIYALWSLA